MRVLKKVEDLTVFLKELDRQVGCLVDTGFLYALSYTDDRLYEKSIEVSEVLVQENCPIYANVICRMEFVDLIFRKQVTLGAIQAFDNMDSNTDNKTLFNLLKNIRDQNTAQQKDNQSYKVNEGRLKKLRKLLNESSPVGWKTFCSQYAGSKLFNEWEILEEDLGLNFLEIMEGDTSEFFESPLLWSEMVQLMGQYGLRGPDAMTLNFFSKSKFPLLVTTDSDFEIDAFESLQSDSEKAVYIL